METFNVVYNLCSRVWLSQTKHSLQERYKQIFEIPLPLTFLLRCPFVLLAKKQKQLSGRYLQVLVQNNNPIKALHKQFAHYFHTPQLHLGLLYRTKYFNSPSTPFKSLVINLSAFRKQEIKELADTTERRCPQNLAYIGNN